MGRESQVRKQSRNLAWMLGTASGPRAEGRVWGGRGWGGGLPTLAWSPGWIPAGPKPRTCGPSADTVGAGVVGVADTFGEGVADCHVAY